MYVKSNLIGQMRSIYSALAIKNFLHIWYRFFNTEYHQNIWTYWKCNTSKPLQGQPSWNWPGLLIFKTSYTETIFLISGRSVYSTIKGE